jgi:hypothetical protein
MIQTRIRKKLAKKVMQVHLNQSQILNLARKTNLLQKNQQKRKVLHKKSVFPLHRDLLQFQGDDKDLWNHLLLFKEINSLRNEYHQGDGRLTQNLHTIQNKDNREVILCVDVIQGHLIVKDALILETIEKIVHIKEKRGHLHLHLHLVDVSPLHLLPESNLHHLLISLENINSLVLVVHHKVQYHHHHLKSQKNHYISEIQRRRNVVVM